MRLRRPTAGERKKGGERGGKRRGCQGGTVCGSLGSGPLPKTVCMRVSVSTQPELPQPVLYYLRSDGIFASQSIFWESWVGKFGNWAQFKTSTLGLKLQFQNYVFSLQPQFSQKGSIIRAKNSLFLLHMLFYMFSSTLPS